ncbi:UNVERIFIED_CONTAM: hypothetical protein GTU68_027664 [Idotea baltica]|nr:hypothetical protein [Idotea baltica]
MTETDTKYKSIEAEIGAVDGRIAILVTRWNSFITDNLLTGAIRSLERNGIDQSQLSVVRVPGAFELPLTAQKIAATGDYVAIIALGCVIRGGTPHFEFVCAGATEGLNRVQLDTGVPVTFGVLTVDDVEHAIERSGEDPNNKGEEAALTALEMVGLVNQIDQSSGTNK